MGKEISDRENKSARIFGRFNTDKWYCLIKVCLGLVIKNLDKHTRKYNLVLDALKSN